MRISLSLATTETILLFPFHSRSSVKTENVGMDGKNVVLLERCFADIIVAIDGLSYQGSGSAILGHGKKQNEQEGNALYRPMAYVTLVPQVKPIYIAIIWSFSQN